METRDGPGRSGLRSFSDIWLGGGCQTALGAAAMAAYASLRFGAARREVIGFAVFTFGGTLALYGGRYALSIRRGGIGEREEALRANPACAASLGALVLLFLGYGVWVLPLAFTAWSAAWGLAGVAYCFPILGKPWREYGTLKPALLALSWTAITCGPPVYEHWVLVASVRFVWLFGLCVAFDYKDVEKDRAHGIRTPAASWSDRTLWSVVAVCLVAGLIGKLLIVPPPQRAPVIVAWGVSLFMLARVRRSRSTRAWVMWGDGMMIAYALIPSLVVAFA